MRCFSFTFSLHLCVLAWAGLSCCKFLCVSRVNACDHAVLHLFIFLHTVVVVLLSC